MYFRKLFLATLWNINQVWERLKKDRNTNWEALMIEPEKKMAGKTRIENTRRGTNLLEEIISFSFVYSLSNTTKDLVHRGKK